MFVTNENVLNFSFVVHIAEFSYFLLDKDAA